MSSSPQYAPAVTATTPTRIPAGRDLSLDLVRVACILLVVVVHVLFSGVRLTDAGIEIERTVELQAWFNPASWAAEIMPLFFVVGGFTAMTTYRSAAAKGRTELDFIRGRVARIARPLIPLFAMFAIVLGGATLLGVDEGLLRAVAVGVGSPLWFVAAFGLVQVLAPTMIRLHERAPRWTLGVLFALVCLVDALRFAIAIALGPHAFALTPLPWATALPGPALLAGLPNVLFVWLFVQQLGFFHAEGRVEALGRARLIAIALAGYAVALGLVWAARLTDERIYSWNMLANQFPPTATIALFGVAQLALLALLRKPLNDLMRVRLVQGVVFVVGTRMMTIYLWHLPMIMVVIGLQLAVPATLVEPGSALWWWSRIPVVLLVLGICWLLSLWLVRFEALPAWTTPAPAASTLALACTLAIASPFLVMVLGLDLPLAILGLLASALAMAILRGSVRTAQ